MDEKDQKFQKNLAFNQIGATVAAAVGAIIMSMGISTLIFGTSLAVEMLNAENKTQHDLTILGKVAAEKGWFLIYSGAALLIGGPAYFSILIYREKMENNSDPKG